MKKSNLQRFKDGERLTEAQLHELLASAREHDRKSNRVPIAVTRLAAVASLLTLFLIATLEKSSPFHSAAMQKICARTCPESPWPLALCAISTVIWLSAFTLRSRVESTLKRMMQFDDLYVDDDLEVRANFLKPFLLVLCAAIVGFLAFDRSEPSDWLFWPLVFVFVAMGVRAVKIAVSRPSILILNDKGLEYKPWFIGVIPWAAIAKANLRQTEPNKAGETIFNLILKLKNEPEFWAKRPLWSRYLLPSPFAKRWEILFWELSGDAKIVQRAIKNIKNRTL